MKSQTLRAQIALSLINGMGAQRITRLLKRYSEPERIFKSSYRELTRIEGIGDGTARQISNFNDWKRVDRIIEQSEKTNVWLLSYADENYPERLKHIYDPPVLIWGKGNQQALNKPGIAIIGTRNPGPYGREMAEDFTRSLRGKGLSIISGLAYGIDTIAHRVCCEQGGVTVGVMGSGIDWIYPSSNKKLVERMLENDGALITEFPPGTKPDAGNFPVRNRVVSGLSLGVLVIESGVTGGSMITARLALDQGREVFVIPHPANTKTGEGCNVLIQRGHGKLVQNVDDVLIEIDVYVDAGKSAAPVSGWKNATLSKQETTVCSSLENGDKHIDELSEETGLPGHKLLPVLLNLEMQGLVKALAGKRFKIL